jgi:hypothetical protein
MVEMWAARRRATAVLRGIVFFLAKKQGYLYRAICVRPRFKRMCFIQKTYIVRLSNEERSTLQDAVKKLKGTSQKVKRAQILLKADADGLQEAQIIAMRLSDSPKGFAKWTLRLLARKVVELKIVESISHETIRRTLQKTT